jgi:hypothetical protein
MYLTGVNDGIFNTGVADTDTVAGHTGSGEAATVEAPCKTISNLLLLVHYF